jgi:putative YhdH/YhfP family quinone oxidoreductase
VERLEHNGLRPGQGPVLVTGASGGVGSTAVAILAARGYEVAASTGSPDAHEYLRRLGARQIVGRAELAAPSDRPLDRQCWAGAVDAVGGSTLATILRTLMLGGSVAVAGNVGGPRVETTVFPFILRGVNALGIDSAAYPIDRRIALWERLAGDLRPPHLEEAIAHEVELDELPEALGRISQGRLRGRAVVRLAG